jgi:pimeloyl-ACP methyl ester carboxylesterase
MPEKGYSLMQPITTYKTATVDGLDIFYREAGPSSASTFLLLHGFPSSSRMWEPLFARLEDRFHLVAPDYPGFGHSSAPSPDAFAYTFDHIAEIMERFTDALCLSRYVLVLQDYGGPVGFRLALSRPERVQALVVQNAVAHAEGLGPPWDARKAYWEDREANEVKLRANLLSLEATRLRHVGGSPNLDRYAPDLWADEFAFLSQPTQDRIQSDLFYDYRSNVASYAKWQAWLRDRQPPTLVTWGEYDPSFTVAGAYAYGRDVPKAEIHILQAGHFPLDEAANEISELMWRFLDGVT